MATSANTKVALPFFAPEDAALGAWAREVHQGKLQCVGTVTLNAASPTTVEDARAGAFSFIGLTPLTLDGASAARTANVYVSTQTKKRFIITHPAVSAGSAIFRYCILG